MSKIAGLIVALLFVVKVVPAQVPTGGNIFFGYSYSGGDISSSHCNTACPPGPFFTTPASRSATFNGWDGSLEGKFLPWIGVVADISQGYGSSTFEIVCNAQPIACPPAPATVKVNSRISTVLFGPRASVSIGRFTPFAHALFGVGHIGDSGGVSNSDTAFATALGGGLDYKLIKGLAWRLQADAIHTRFFNSGQDHFRFSTGIVFRF